MTRGSSSSKDYRYLLLFFNPSFLTFAILAETLQGKFQDRDPKALRWKCTHFQHWTSVILFDIGNSSVLAQTIAKPLHSSNFGQELLQILSNGPVDVFLLSPSQYNVRPQVDFPVYEKYKWCQCWSRQPAPPPASCPCSGCCSWSPPPRRSLRNFLKVSSLSNTNNKNSH